jgi:four helix bundle protein
MPRVWNVWAYHGVMHRFRSLDVWKVAKKLSRVAYKATNSERFRGHFALGDQIRRAAISIPANLAEGYGLSTRAQLLRCAYISLGSAYELDVEIELAHDVGVIEDVEFHEIDALTRRCTSLLIGFINGLKRGRSK